MDTNNRRTFLKKCAALTAGALVVGPVTKLMGNPADEWRWVGYCGVKCDDSCSYFKNNQCPSCKSINYNCTVQKCAKAKQVPTCAHCNELDTCNDQFWINNPDKYDDIKKLRDSLGLTSIDINVLSQQEVLLFPNPAQDYLKIQNPKNYIFNYELANVNGQIVKLGAIVDKELTINISDLKPGSYLFKMIRNKNVLQIQKVLKL